MSDPLRQFYDILGACGMIRPAWEVWLAHATENAEFWPIDLNGDGKMVGGVLWKGHTVHIAVLPEARGRWITKARLRAWRESFRHAVPLYATPATDNAAACKLARGLGFVFKTHQGPMSVFEKPANLTPETTTEKE